MDNDSVFDIRQSSIFVPTLRQPLHETTRHMQRRGSSTASGSRIANQRSVLRLLRNMYILYRVLSRFILKPVRLSRSF